MISDPNCAYCQRGELLDKFGYLACELKSSLVIIFREQSHPGRVIVAHKKHVSELTDLSDAERDLYFSEVAQVAHAIHTLYHPDKLNYGAYGDGGSHLHFHLVPKYEGEFEWGTPFAMNPGETYLDEETYESMAEEIRSELGL